MMKKLDTSVVVEELEAPGWEHSKVSLFNFFLLAMVAFSFLILVTLVKNAQQLFLKAGDSLSEKPPFELRVVHRRKI